MLSGRGEVGSPLLSGQGGVGGPMCRDSGGVCGPREWMAGCRGHEGSPDVEGMWTACSKIEGYRPDDPMLTACALDGSC